MDPVTIAIATAIGGSLVQVGSKLVEKGVVEPALKPATDKLARLVGRGYDKAADDASLQKAVEKALAAVGVPVGTSDVEQYAINLADSGNNPYNSNNNIGCRGVAHDFLPLPAMRCVAIRRRPRLMKDGVTCSWPWWAYME